MALRKYRRRQGSTVQAVRLDLEMDGFEYTKWGGTQRCKAGDWIVKNGEDTYTVDADTFALTYRLVAGAEYRKIGHVWAQRAERAGSIPTKEGVTHYEAGDFVVYNQPDGGDGYAIARATFDELYEPE